MSSTFDIRSRITMANCGKAVLSKVQSDPTYDWYSVPSDAAVFTKWCVLLTFPSVPTKDPCQQEALGWRTDASKRLTDGCEGLGEPLESSRWFHNLDKPLEQVTVSHKSLTNGETLRDRSLLE